MKYYMRMYIQGVSTLKTRPYVFNMSHVNSLFDLSRVMLTMTLSEHRAVAYLGHLIDLPRPAQDIGEVIRYSSPCTLEVGVINRIKSDDGRPQADIRLGES